MSNLPDPPGDGNNSSWKGEASYTTLGLVSHQVEDLSPAPTTRHLPFAESHGALRAGVSDLTAEPTAALATPSDHDGLFQPSRSWARVVFEAAAGLSVTPPFRGGLFQPPRYRPSGSPQGHAFDIPEVTTHTPIVTPPISGRNPSEQAVTTMTNTHGTSISALRTLLLDLCNRITPIVHTLFTYLHFNWYHEPVASTAVPVPLSVVSAIQYTSYACVGYFGIV